MKNEIIALPTELAQIAENVSIEKRNEVQNVLNQVFNGVSKMREIRKDLYTQSEYAKLIGCTQPRVNQMMKEGKLNTLHVNGTVLIKVSKIDLYR